jgi:hypothetical protein
VSREQLLVIAAMTALLAAIALSLTIGAAYTWTTP